MTARKSSKVTQKYKTKYRVRNWRSYNESLCRRGDVTLWLDEAAVAGWSAPPSGRPGGQPRYSDLAILTVLTLRAVFQLALRQAEGFTRSLVRLMGLSLAVPDYSTLSRRGSKLHVLKVPRPKDGPLHLVIDSTGLKFSGSGPWHETKHGGTKKRRQWKKLHLAVDAGGFIISSELTGSDTHDAPVGQALIDRMEEQVASFRADGAYDTRAVYEALHAVGTPELDIAIPPRQSASCCGSTEGAWRQREAALQRIEEVGRRQWRKEAGANQQARAENAMYRYKQIIGGNLRARAPDQQQVEARIGVMVMNKMTRLGMPDSCAVRSEAMDNG